jgi:DNA-binding NarL/FixJ family response regulator
MVAAAESLRPDVIVVDIGLPKVDGITAANAIHRRHPGMRMVILTVHDQQALVDRALDSGALGFVPKILASDELLPAVHAALRGEHYIASTSASARVRSGDE